MKETEDASVDTAPPPRRRRRLVLAAVAVTVLLIGGGTGAYLMWGQEKSAGKSAEAEAVPDGLVSFDTFLVNLADTESRAYLRTTLKLLVTNEQQAKHLAEDQAARSQVRSAILEVLATQSGARLVTPEGKAELKRLIMQRVAAFKFPVEVHDVLFSDFVVQY